MHRDQKITLGEMRANNGPRLLIVYCSDHKCLPFDHYQFLTLARSRQALGFGAPLLLQGLRSRRR